VGAGGGDHDRQPALPKLFGEEIRIHKTLVFFAIAGGLALLGVSGLVLGPVALVTAIGRLNALSRRSTRRAT